MHVAFTNLFFS
uniref:Uncharacterized protein n=1 Tax=Anguilla anguilla TaxID=7936 RepID=A0A0E9TKP1_ANGAN